MNLCDFFKEEEYTIFLCYRFNKDDTDLLILDLTDFILII